MSASPGHANSGGVEPLGGNVDETDVLAFVELPKQANLPHAKGAVAVVEHFNVEGASHRQESSRRKRAIASRLRAGKTRPATDHDVA